MSDTSSPVPTTKLVDTISTSAKSEADQPRITPPAAIVDPNSNGSERAASVHEPNAGSRELRPDTLEVIRPIAADGELKVRLLKEHSDERKRDRWDKADIIAKLLSGVVIAGVGLLINSSIQRGQIASSEASVRAQMEAAKLKATDEKKLQEGALTAQLVQHLSSDNPTQREIAIIALRESVPQNIYDATLAVLARSDPSKDVRLRAIDNLSASPTVDATKVLTSIAKDPERPPEERTAAKESSRTSALSQILAGSDEIIFAAASDRGVALERGDVGHGVFTYAVLQGLQGKADVNGDGVVTASELGRYVGDNVKQYTGGRQTPVFSSNRSGEAPLNKPRSPNSKVYALVVGISSYADKEIFDLAYTKKDANSFAELYSTMFGAKVYMLTGEAASKEQILSTIQRVAQSVGPEDVLIFYYGGMGHILEGRGMLIPYNARRDSPASFIPMEELKLSLKDVRHKVFYIDTCFAGDLAQATR